MSVGQWSFCKLYIYSNYSGSRGSKAMKMIGCAKFELASDTTRVSGEIIPRAQF